MKYKTHIIPLEKFENFIHKNVEPTMMQELKECGFNLDNTIKHDYRASTRDIKFTQKVYDKKEIFLWNTIVKFRKLWYGENKYKKLYTLGEIK